MKTYTFKPEICIAGNWLMPIMGDGFESFESAESFARWAAKTWLGVAESRVAGSREEESQNMVALARSRWDLVWALLVSVKHDAERQVLNNNLRREKIAKLSKRESLAAYTRKRRAELDDAIEAAELSREYRENMWNNHDCDVEESY
jgi:hypothetical protein